MANYIGNVPASGEFKRLDSIASLFNGSTTQFNLTYNSVSHTAGDASQLIVSLNGIVQEPLESYTLGIGGSSIIFSTAPASGDTCHIVLLGGVGSTVTPTDGSVTATKLDPALKDYYEDEYVANGSTTDFTLSRASAGVNSLLVTIDGIVQPTSAYTASGTTLTISPALPNGTNIRVVHMGVKAGVYVPQAGSVGLNEVDLTAFDNRYYQTGDNISVGTIDASGAITTGSYIDLQTAGTTKGNIYTNASTMFINTQNTITSLNAAGGNVGIGTITPQQLLHVNGGAGDTTIQITNSASGSSATDGFSLTVENPSGDVNIRNREATNMRFYTSNSERARFDSSGNLLVGTTSTGAASLGSGGKGININNSGAVELARSANPVLFVNRTTSNGDIVQFRKDGATVGSIGSEGGDSVYIGNGDAGLKFSGGADVVQPFNPSTVAARDAAISLGTSGARFKDLYLSGGVYLGGTGTANHLDDYEEGTFDPSLNNSNYLSSSTGTYTKIGSVVHVWLGLQISGSASGSLLVNNLPFYVTSSSWSGHVAIQNTGSTDIYPFVHNESYNLWIRNSGNNDYNASSFAGKFIYVQATYFTSQ